MNLLIQKAADRIGEKWGAGHMINSLKGWYFDRGQVIL